MIDMSDQAKNEFKLKKILASCGCEMRPNGEIIDIIAEDGEVVFQGNITQLREKMLNNVKQCGKPIIHASVRLFNDESNLIKSKRAAILRGLNDSFDKELERHNLDVAALAASVSKLAKEGVDVKDVVALEAGLTKELGTEIASVKETPQKKKVVFVADVMPREGPVASGDCDSRVFPPVDRSYASTIPPVVVVRKHCEAGRLAPGCGVLPTNRVGTLQEIYQPSGQTPAYHIIETTRKLLAGMTMEEPGSRASEKNEKVFTCQVVVPPLDAFAVGTSKKSAKQAAAGNMLLILEGKVPPHVGAADGDATFVYSESYVPSDVEDGKPAAEIKIKKLAIDKSLESYKWPDSCFQRPLLGVPQSHVPKKGKKKAVKTTGRGGKPRVPGEPRNRNRSARRAHLRLVTDAQLEKWGNEFLDLGVDFLKYDWLEDGMPCPQGDVPGLGAISEDTLALMKMTEEHLDCLEKETMDLSIQKK